PEGNEYSLSVRNKYWEDASVGLSRAIRSLAPIEIGIRTIITMDTISAVFLPSRPPNIASIIIKIGHTASLPYSVMNTITGLSHGTREFIVSISNLLSVLI